MVNGVQSASDKYSVNTLRARSFYRVAWNIWHQWQETGTSDTRLLQEPIISDSFVEAGVSKKGKGHKEHVVPRVLLCNQCYDMFAAGRTIEESAEMLAKYLKIIHIHPDEQKYLDKTLKLKERMPEGWTFGKGDPFARLHEARIEFELYSPIP